MAYTRWLKNSLQPHPFFTNILMRLMSMNISFRGNLSSIIMEFPKFEPRGKEVGAGSPKSRKNHYSDTLFWRSPKSNFGNSKIELVTKIHCLKPHQNIGNNKIYGGMKVTCTFQPLCITHTINLSDLNDVFINLMLKLVVILRFDCWVWLLWLP